MPTHPRTPAPAAIVPVELAIETVILARGDLAIAAEAHATHVEAADYATSIANGDRAAALATLLGSALDFHAVADYRAAIIALGSASVIVKRIAAARAEGVTP